MRYNNLYKILKQQQQGKLYSFPDINEKCHLRDFENETKFRDIVWDISSTICDNLLTQSFEQIFTDNNQEAQVYIFKNLQTQYFNNLQVFVIKDIHFQGISLIPNRSDNENDISLIHKYLPYFKSKNKTNEIGSIIVKIPESLYKLSDSNDIFDLFGQSIYEVILHEIIHLDNASKNPYDGYKSIRQNNIRNILEDLYEWDNTTYNHYKFYDINDINDLSYLCYHILYYIQETEKQAYTEQFFAQLEYYFQNKTLKNWEHLIKSNSQLEYFKINIAIGNIKIWLKNYTEKLQNIDNTDYNKLMNILRNQPDSNTVYKSDDLYNFLWLALKKLIKFKKDLYSVAKIYFTGN